MLRGMDASAVQGAIPFWQCSRDMRFVILKAQQGNEGFDSNFKKNVDLALAEGIEPFAYCFAYPLPAKKGVYGRDPKEQAKLFVDRTLGASRAMEGRPFFLDYEWPELQDWQKWGCSAKQIADWCRDNAAKVERLSGVKPVIYTYPFWWENILLRGGDLAWAADYPLWIASYPKVVGWPKDGDKPVMPDPWKTWLFWQFDGNGGLKLPNGVDADFCVFNGDEDALQRLAGKASGDRPAGDGVLGDAAETVCVRR